MGYLFIAMHLDQFWVTTLNFWAAQKYWSGPLYNLNLHTYIERIYI